MTTEKQEEEVGRAFQIFSRKVQTLYPQLAGQGGIGLMAELCKSALENDTSNQPLSTGLKPHPFNFRSATTFQIHNIHHSICIGAKKQAIAGLGHKDDKVEEILDPLCNWSWQDTLSRIVEDYLQTGNGYLEVVRNDVSLTITGLHWLPAVDVRVHIEDLNGNLHYEIGGSSYTSSQDPAQRTMARFGDLKDFKARRKIQPGAKVSEVIHFAEPSTVSRYYGFPSWLAAVATIELVQAMMQHQMDFHVNRGVPEFLLFVLGQVNPTTWTALTESFQSFVGVGNQNKSGVYNLNDPNIKIQLEKLAVEGAENGTFFKDMSETLAVNVVSAHRVPPSLGGILIPGKMGASNEATNAIMSFQALVAGPYQKSFRTTLGNTLGNKKHAKGLGLGRRDFSFRTITEEMADSMKLLQPADTMGKMKEELPEAAAEGRDLSQGVKD